MVQFCTLFNALSKNISTKPGKKSRIDIRKEAAGELAKEAKKNDKLLTSFGASNSSESKSFAAGYSKKGKKGLNQDCFVIWEEFGCQDDMVFCGVFDGHGPWGHLVAKRVRESMPASLLGNWQEAVAQHSVDLDNSLVLNENDFQFDVWKQSYLKTCASVDQELQQRSAIHSFYSGTTALTLVLQGNLLIVANVGDSRAVLATKSDNRLIATQLTNDLKPNLPHEKSRIAQSRGRIFSCPDEPDVYRIWMPSRDSLKGPGLAISRAFGDYYIKDFGLISEPEVMQRNISGSDQFVILATDGVWDVISNEEAVKIVASTPNSAQSAKRLVECAVCAWKSKGRTDVMDDISAVCLFFHDSNAPQPVNETKLNVKFV